MKFFPVLTLLLLFAGSIAAQNPAKYDFSAAAMDGTTVDTVKLRGKVLVYNLWFINCPNCIEEMKLLNQLATDYAGNGDVVFIAPAASRKADIEKFLKKNPFNYRVIPDAAQLILGKFGTADKKGDIELAFPMHLVIDRSGNAVVQAQGIKGIDAVRRELAKQFPTAKASVR
jgi:peroxiredoxin